MHLLICDPKIFYRLVDVILVLYYIYLFYFHLILCSAVYPSHFLNDCQDCINVIKNEFIRRENLSSNAQLFEYKDKVRVCCDVPWDEAICAKPEIGTKGIIDKNEKCPKNHVPVKFRYKDLGYLETGNEKCVRYVPIWGLEKIKLS